jgi:hypothetical protein
MLFADRRAVAKAFGGRMRYSTACFHIKTCLYDYVSL